MKQKIKKLEEEMKMILAENERKMRDLTQELQKLKEAKIKLDEMNESLQKQIKKHPDKEKNIKVIY